MAPGGGLASGGALGRAEAYALRRPYCGQAAALHEEGTAVWLGCLRLC